MAVSASFRKSVVLFTIAGFVLNTLCQHQAFGGRQSVPFQLFQERAERENSVLLPLNFPETADAVKERTDAVLDAVEAKADGIAAVSSDDATFENTVGALDDIGFGLWSEFGVIYLMKETSPIEAVREAGTDAVNRVEEWDVAFGYREDIYESVKRYADQGVANALEPEAKKYFDETMRAYRRKGFALPSEQRAELERLQKRIANLETEFRNNVRNASAKIEFTREELQGLPASVLEDPSFQTGEDTWTLDASTTFQYVLVAENAESVETRKRFYLARYNRAREVNLPLLKEIVTLRHRVATMLGYASWADYQTEIRMAGSEARVRELLENLTEGLEKNFRAERARLLKLKEEHLGEANLTFEDWDRSFYSNRLKKTAYDIDTEALRRYFPYQQVLEGMFGLYEHLFGIVITPVSGVPVWEPSVEPYVISNAADGKVLGLFYLDMFPREGKYKHFASFGVVNGKRYSDGRYRRPVNVLVCNFPPPTTERPSLLSFNETETLFHEFGHLLHACLTRAHFAAFAGTSVPRDFVEAPSQMLEFWLEDISVLNRFAADYQDASKTLPAAVLERLIEAEKSTIASHYRGQIALGMMDLNLHTSIEDPDAIDPLAITQRAWEDYYAPLSADTAFAASFGHLMGYDAGYYGYIWSEVIAADMAAEFRTAPEGYLDATMGMRLRNEIYAVGDSRDIDISIERFLGRPVDPGPFFESVGLGSGDE